MPLHAARRHRLRPVRAKTTFGRIGVKVWIYKGDIVGGKRELTASAPSGRPSRRGASVSTRPRRSGASGTTATSTDAGRTPPAKAPPETAESGCAGDRWAVAAVERRRER